MAAWTDLDDTKERVSMVALIERYADGETHTDKPFKILCPFHDETNPSLSVTPEKNVWFCHGACKIGGDILTYTCLKEDIADPKSVASRRKAARLVDEWFGIVREKPGTEKEIPTPEPEPVAVIEAPEEEPDEAIVINPPYKYGELKSLDVEAGIAYAVARGVPGEIAQTKGLAVALKGRLKGQLVIPIHDHNGILIGYAGRSLDEKPKDKYLFPSKAHGFYKSHLLYNLNHVLSLPVKRFSVVLVEGFFGCFAIQAAGFPCVALMGTHLSPTQAEMLAAHFQNVLIALDGDEAGQKGTDNALLTLGSRSTSEIEIGTALSPLYVRAIRFPVDTQPDHFKTEELQQLLRVYA